MNSSLTRRGVAAVLVLGTIGLACVIYTPWAGRPFDILDFSEFLPLLRRESWFGTRFLALSDYYLHEHGRLNLVSYAALAAKWSILGDATMLWQWLRFFQMVLLVAGVYLLARRLDAGRVGAAAGAALFVSARSAEEAWIRLTMGEPLGLSLMLGAALVITGDRKASRSDVRASVIAGALVAAAILAKEMLVAWVPVLLLLALCYREDGSLGPSVWDTRSRSHVLAVVGAALATGVAVVLAASGRGAESLTASYQVQSLTPARAAGLWNQMVMPENSFARSSMWLHPANLFLAVTCLGGLALACTRPEARRHALLISAIAAGLPAIGVLLYLPWPYFNPFYALPFLVGPALLLSTAVTAVERYLPRARWSAYAGAAGISLFAAFHSAYVARVTIAHQQVNGEVAQLLPAYATVDSIVVAQPYAPQQKWQGPGPTLVRYALSMGIARRLPPAVDITCVESRGLLGERLGNTLLVSYTFFCGAVPGASRRVRRYFRYFDYPALAVVTDSVGADLLAP